MRKLVTAHLLLVLSAVTNADESATPPPAKEPALRDELLLRVKTDQDARKAMIEWLKVHGKNGVADPSKLEGNQKVECERLLTAVQQADEENTKRLRQIVEQYGWPTYSLAGKDGAASAWLLIQHADAVPKFQRQCLDLMGNLPKGEVSLRNIAYLTDRVLLAEGKQQRYGTQLIAVDGKWQLRPIENEAQVDAKRAEMGMEPLAEYVKSFENLYGPVK